LELLQFNARFTKVSMNKNTW